MSINKPTPPAAPVPQKPAPPSPPTPPVVPPPAAKPEEPEKLVLKALHDFKVMMNGQLLEFKKDQLITDTLTAQYLLDKDQPAKPVKEKINFYYCSNCHCANHITPNQ